VGPQWRRFRLYKATFKPRLLHADRGSLFVMADHFRLTRFDLQTLGLSSAVAYIHSLDPPVIHGDIRAVRSLNEIVVTWFTYTLRRKMS
jgi:hypothetical protein